MKIKDFEILFQEETWYVLRHPEYGYIVMAHACNDNTGRHPNNWICPNCQTSVPDSIKTLAIFARQNTREIRPLNS